MAWQLDESGKYTLVPEHGHIRPQRKGTPGGLCLGGCTPCACGYLLRSLTVSDSQGCGCRRNRNREAGALRPFQASLQLLGCSPGMRHHPRKLMPQSSQAVPSCVCLFTWHALACECCDAGSRRCKRGWTCRQHCTISTREPAARVSRCFGRESFGTRCRVEESAAGDTVGPSV